MTSRPIPPAAPARVTQPTPAAPAPVTPDADLLDLIKQKPLGWKIHDLYSALSRLPPTEAAGGLTEEDNPFSVLYLFRRNFRLMRQLFLLQRQLEADGDGSLVISCMDIHFVSQQNVAGSGNGCTLPDSYSALGAYYLDESNYYRCDEAEIAALLDDFWRRFATWNDRTALLDAWGIDPGLPYEDIQSRIRAMAREHHPDHGGDPETFSQLWGLWEEYRKSRQAGMRSSV